MKPTIHPLAVAQPAAAPTLAVPASEAGLPWGWAILPVVLLVMVVGWLVLRRRRSGQG